MRGAFLGQNPVPEHGLCGACPGAARTVEPVHNAVLESVAASACATVVVNGEEPELGADQPREPAVVAWWCPAQKPTRPKPGSGVQVFAQKTMAGNGRK